MAETMKGLKRTHYCGVLRPSDEGKDVTVCGLSLIHICYYNIAIPNFPLRGISLSAYRHFCTQVPQVIDRHFILRKGTGFIRTDDIGTSQCFYRRQFLDQCVLFSHFLYR